MSAEAEVSGGGKDLFWLFTGIGALILLACLGMGGCGYLWKVNEPTTVYVTNSFNTLPKP